MLRAWIAIGDRAWGVLFAMNVAVGGIAIGGVAVGGISFGGLGVGLLTIAGVGAGGIAIGGCPIGGCPIGGCAIGGMAMGGRAVGGRAVGWLAFGGVALAWRGAVGGVAIARGYAMGGGVYAPEANNETAQAIVESSDFFGTAESAERWLTEVSPSGGLPAIIVLAVALVLIMFLAGYRRKRS